MHAAHDNLFQFTFRHAHHAAGWLRSVLPPPIAAAIAWSRLLPVRERFPGVRVRPHLVDAAFVAPLGPGHESLDVLLPVEHKSFHDPDLELQLLRYSVHLQRALQAAPGKHPLVLPVVVRHDGRTPRAVAGDPVIAQLAAWQPRQRVFVDDLAATSEAELARRSLTPLAELTLLCLRHLPRASPDEVPAAFLRWQHLLRAVDHADGTPTAPPVGADAVDAIGWYALAVSDVDSLRLSETLAHILHRDDRSIMSTLERTFRDGVRKGHEVGRAEGTSEGHAHALLLLLAQRFGRLDAAVTARVRAGSRDDLDRWTQRVLPAPTLADVFGTDPDS